MNVRDEFYKLSDGQWKRRKIAVVIALLLGTAVYALFSLLWALLVFVLVLGLVELVYKILNNDEIAVFVAAISLFILAILTFIHDEFTPEYLTAFATVVLAAVTMQYVNLTAKMVNEMHKERTGVVKRDVISEVIQPTIQTLLQNKSTIQKNRLIQWHSDNAVSSSPVYHSMTHRLALLTRRENVASGMFTQFQRESPDLWRQMEKHDSKLTELHRVAKETVETLQSRGVGPYIKENEITLYENKLAEPEIVVDLVLNDVSSLRDTDQYHDLWNEHQKDIKRIAGEAGQEDLQNFREVKREYLRIVDSLTKRLVERRDEMRQEFGIPLEDVVEEEESRL